MVKVYMLAGLLVLATLGHARVKKERVELETAYKSMSRAFSLKDVRGYTAFWTPAVRWFPPHHLSSAMLTKGRADLVHDLRVEFSKPDRTAQVFAFSRFESEADKATIDLAISTTHIGSSYTTHTFSERHHWLRAGGRWFLCRIEAVG
jgi:hypothetical protein